MNSAIEVMILDIGLILLPLLILVPVYLIVGMVVKRLHITLKYPRVFTAVVAVIVTAIAIGILLFVAAAGIEDLPNQA